MNTYNTDFIPKTLTKIIIGNKTIMGSKTGIDQIINIYDNNYIAHNYYHIPVSLNKIPIYKIGNKTIMGSKTGIDQIINIYDNNYIAHNYYHIPVSLNKIPIYKIGNKTIMESKTEIDQIIDIYYNNYIDIDSLKKGIRW